MTSCIVNKVKAICNQCVVMSVSRNVTWRKMFGVDGLVNNKHYWVRAIIISRFRIACKFVLTEGLHDISEFLLWTLSFTCISDIMLNGNVNGLGLFFKACGKAISIWNIFHPSFRLLEIHLGPVFEIEIWDFCSIQSWKCTGSSKLSTAI